MSTKRKPILVDMWEGDYEEGEDTFVGQRKIDADHKICYDNGEYYFSKCINCDVWECGSHEDADHICEEEG